MMTSAQVFETSVTTTDNGPSQDYTHPDDQTTFLNVILFSQISESEEMWRNLVFEKKAFRRLSRLIMPVELKIIYKLTQA